MLEAAEKLEAQGVKGRDRFDQEEIVQLALVHLVQIIGEAASRISDDLRRRHPEIPWRQVVGMRNRVVHGYFEVDLDLLWGCGHTGCPEVTRSTGRHPPRRRGDMTAGAAIGEPSRVSCTPSRVGRMARCRAGSIRRPRRRRSV
ncbi:MAG: HepT-like ribonuclease domain-containing protein [Pseudonocardiaceae bacterium]